MKKIKKVGILTSGGDCPGLNAVIRGFVKAATRQYGIECVGIHDGFKGLVTMQTEPLDDKSVSGLLTMGGTILGTAREKPNKMMINGEKRDMTETIMTNIKTMGLDALICLGGGGTQKNAYYLMKQGVPVVTLPKTIDNDVANTDITFGFDTAMQIATDAIDRLHSTASSHQRVMVVEIMGHNAGWLTLGAGVSGGADVILIPEIPYDMDAIAKALKERHSRGKRFSIVAVAEGAISLNDAEHPEEMLAKQEKLLRKLDEAKLPYIKEPLANKIARKIELATGLETRVTTLGHVQRGGIPTATDRFLSTRLGVTAAQCVSEGILNVMISVKGNRCEPVPLETVAGQKKRVPLDHPWVETARLCGISFGD